MKTTALMTAIVATLFIGALPSHSYSQESGNGQPDPAQVARGAKAWADQCGRCHNLRSPGELRAEEWYVSATHMRVRANIPGDVIRDIQAFLMASSPKK